MHVRYRVEKKAEQNQAVSVKLKRRWSFSGPQTSTSVKTVTTPRLRFPRLATIVESTPTTSKRTQQKQEKAAKDTSSSELKQKYSALFPLKSSRNSTPRSLVRQKPLSLSLAQQDFAPFIGDLNRNGNDIHSLSFSNLPNKDITPRTSFFLKEASVDPRSSGRSGKRRTVSQTAIAGNEVFSSSSDQYGMGKKVVKRAQSYTEEHKHSDVHNWLEENSAGKQIRRRRPQSAPSRSRPQLKGR